MCKSLIVSDVFLIATQLATQRHWKTVADREKCHYQTIDAGGGGRHCRRPVTSLMDKTVWKIFAKERPPTTPRFLHGFSLADSAHRWPFL